MEEVEDDPFSGRGIKRKRQADGVKLTFAQRLAAARKTPNKTESESDAEANEKSSIQAADSSDVEESHETTHQIQRDERYRKLYDNDIDFATLADKDDEFRACLKGGKHVDFTDPASVMQLTRTLLKLDFGLQIELPEDRLCPPVPNRHNYILWIKQLLDSSSASYSDFYEPERKVTGIDIGTGASAIYPLLGCVQRPSWSFVATDIDAKSLTCARNNVALNHLESQIKITERTAKDSLIPVESLDTEDLDFLMTNPPFYASAAELFERAKLKAQPPNSACTGAPNEMVCNGGEIGFFKRIFEESLELKTRIQWYTTMLGKQSSLEVIVEILRNYEVENYAMTEFVQGNKTRRWAIAWSFGTRRPSNTACRGFEPSAGKKILPYPTDMTAASKLTKSGSASQLENVFWTQLEDVTDGLDLLSWRLDEDRLRVVGFAMQNVWSRAYRRNKQSKLSTGKGSRRDSTAQAISSSPFGFSITIRTQDAQEDGKKNVAVVVRWLQGLDYALFESFSGMLRNALLNVVS